MKILLAIQIMVIYTVCISCISMKTKESEKGRLLQPDGRLRVLVDMGNASPDK